MKIASPRIPLAQRGISSPWKWKNSVLKLAAVVAILTSGVAIGQITEATTQPPESPKPRFPQLPGDTPGDQVKPRTDPPAEDKPNLIGSEKKPNEAVGRIQKINGRRLSMRKNDKAAVEVFTVSPAAEVTLNRKPAELAELNVYDFVRITKMEGKPEVAVKVAAARVVRDAPNRAASPRTVRPPGKTQLPLPDRQGGLGLVVSDSPNEGVLILDVNQETPAWLAKIQTGDYLLSVADTAIVTPDDFLTTVRSHAPNETIEVVVWRNGKARKGEVELTTRAAARDREAKDDRALILAETHGDDAVVIKRTPGRTERLDQEPEKIVLDREPDGSAVIVERKDNHLPAKYDDLVREHRRLHERVIQLEEELERLKR